MIAPFPRIAHLPGSHAAKDDLVLNDDDTGELLSQELCAVDKLDGINCAVALQGRRILVDVKPAWRKVLAGDVGRALRIHLRQREDALQKLLGRGGVLYCEWLWHTVSLRHDTLPDVTVGFALRDARGRLVPIDEARGRIADVGMTPSVLVWRGVPGSIARVQEIVRRHQKQTGVETEGLILEEVRPGSIRFGKWVERSYRHVKAGTLRGGLNMLAPDAPRPVVWLPQAVTTFRRARRSPRNPQRDHPPRR